MICPSCATVVAGDSTFCPKCGAKMRSGHDGPQRDGDVPGYVPASSVQELGRQPTGISRKTFIFAGVAVVIAGMFAGGALFWGGYWQGSIGQTTINAEPAVAGPTNEQLRNALARAQIERLGKLARAQIEALGKALDQYRLDTGHYPSTEQGLVALMTKPANETKWDGPYLKGAVPADPWGRPYKYKKPGEHGEYDLWSFGKDGQAGGTDEAADINSWE